MPMQLARAPDAPVVSLVDEHCTHRVGTQACALSSASEQCEVLSCDQVSRSWNEMRECQLRAKREQASAACWRFRSASTQVRARGLECRKPFRLHLVFTSPRTRMVNHDEV